jgi:predicted nuclease of predicted toxin-antitoxin system
LAVRLLLDEDIPFDLAEPLRRRGIEAAHVAELRDSVWGGRDRILDADVCVEAARQPTLLITLNVRDYADRAFQEANVRRHGIAVLIVRVPKHENGHRDRPQAIHDIVHRWAHRATSLQSQAPVVASVSRAGIRAFLLR